MTECAFSGCSERSVARSEIDGIPLCKEHRNVGERAAAVLDRAFGPPHLYRQTFCEKARNQRVLEEVDPIG